MRQKGNGRGKRGAAGLSAALAAMMMLTMLLAPAASLALGAAEGQEIVLPDSVHRLRIPAGMVFQMPAASEPDLKGIWTLQPDLEMLVFSYTAEGFTARALAEQLDAAGKKAEERRIGDTEFLFFQDTDEADGAVCVGYAYLYGSQMIEMTFFCGSQGAMDLTKTIMESFAE